MATGPVFRFNFAAAGADMEDNEEEEEEEEDPGNNVLDLQQRRPIARPPPRPCVQLTAPFPGDVELQRTGLEIDRVDLPELGQHPLYRRNAHDVEQRVAVRGLPSAVATTVAAQSDLIRGLYEGGLKTWECAYDLVAFLGRAEAAWPVGVRVLELGCGSALPGIWALRHGASVDLQDYVRRMAGATKAEVIQEITWPNVVLNVDPAVVTALHAAPVPCRVPWPAIGPHPALARVRFFAGPWASLLTALAAAGSTGYDAVLMSETLYDPAHYPALARLLVQLLQPDGSFALIASKTYYFGVGGGTRLFEAHLREHAPSLAVQTVWSTSATVHREILRVHHVHPVQPA